MKIAITSSGESLDSQVDQRFGRAAYFMIGDPETMDFSAVANENVVAAGGAGISSAKVVIDAGAEVVLTGNCGPKAESALTGSGVRLYTGVTGTVKDAIKLFKTSKLTQTDGPSVEQHFGMGK